MASRYSVHPHACGEHGFWPAPTAWSTGSSPRLWGTPNGEPVPCRVYRFIPTPVGNTDARSAADYSQAVHPHACGEHICSNNIRCFISGSSPRLWGTPVERFFGSLSERFIPTPVGNTTIPRPWWLIITVHPHACGEHLARTVIVARLPGSSPRLWGTPKVPAIIKTLARFIPTPVGNTSDSWLRITGQSVHPHACGEHRRSAACGPACGGSSPRLWGTPPNPAPNSPK